MDLSPTRTKSAAEEAGPNRGHKQRRHCGLFACLPLHLLLGFLRINRAHIRQPQSRHAIVFLSIANGCRIRKHSSPTTTTLSLYNHLLVSKLRTVSIAKTRFAYIDQVTMAGNSCVVGTKPGCQSPAPIGLGESRLLENQSTLRATLSMVSIRIGKFFGRAVEICTCAYVPISPVPQKRKKKKRKRWW